MANIRFRQFNETLTAIKTAKMKSEKNGTSFNLKRMYQPKLLGSWKALSVRISSYTFFAFQFKLYKIHSMKPLNPRSEWMGNQNNKTTTKWKMCKHKFFHFGNTRNSKYPDHSFFSVHTSMNRRCADAIWISCSIICSSFRSILIFSFILSHY